MRSRFLYRAAPFTKSSILSRDKRKTWRRFSVYMFMFAVYAIPKFLSTLVMRGHENT